MDYLTPIGEYDGGTLCARDIIDYYMLVHDVLVRAAYSKLDVRMLVPSLLEDMWERPLGDRQNRTLVAALEHALAAGCYVGLIEDGKSYEGRMTVSPALYAAYKKSTKNGNGILEILTTGSSFKDKIKAGCDEDRYYFLGAVASVRGKRLWYMITALFESPDAIFNFNPPENGHSGGVIGLFNQRGRDASDSRREFLKLFRRMLSDFEAFRARERLHGTN